MVQMQIRTVLLGLVIILFGIFVVLNWGAFLAPTNLSLGIIEIEAPLGLIMLILLASLLVVLLVYVVYLRTTVSLDSDRYMQEMKTQRELINQSEASRFAEMREYFGKELRGMSDRDKETRKEVLSRLDKLDRDLRHALRQREADNGPAAQQAEEALRQREEYKQKLQAQLDEWKGRLNDLKVKASESEGVSKAEIDQQIQDIEGKISEAESKLTELTELNEAGDDAWESVRKRAESSWESLRSAIGDVAAKLRD